MNSYLKYKVDRLRLAKLIRRGLKVGRNVYIMEGVELDVGYPFLIEIGDNCRISKGVRILAHDATTFRDLGVTRIAPVRILQRCFIGERTIILPGVTIGPNSLIATGSVVNRDIGEDVVAAGNPARPYGKFSELLAKYSEEVRAKAVFHRKDIESGTVTPEDMVRAVEKEGFAFSTGVPSSDPFYVNTDYAEIRQAAERAYERFRSVTSVPEAGEIGNGDR